MPVVNSVPSFWLGVRLGNWFNCAMKSLRAIAAYLVFVFVGGALLAPWLYAAVQGLASHSPALAKLADNPFHRFVNRSWIVLALVGLWPFMRALGVRSWADLGLVNPRNHLSRLGWGFTAGFCSLAVAAVVTVLSGARRWHGDQSLGGLAGDFITAVLAASVVGFIEELLFRGALFGALRRDLGVAVALVASSCLYALMHFFQKPEPLEEVNWLSGLALLPRMMRGFGEFHELVPGFFNLALAGMLLALAYQRTRNLWFSIGLHAGWIFWLKFYRGITRGTGADDSFWGSSKLIDGWASFLVLLFTLLIVWKWLPERQAHDDHHNNDRQKLA